MLLLLALPAASRAGDVDVGALLKETEEAVEKVDASLEQAAMLGSLAMAYAQRGDRQKAVKLLDRAVKLAIKNPAAGNKGWAQHALSARAIEEQAKLGDIAGAVKNAEAMRDALRLKFPEFGSVAKGQAQAGDVAGAWATCDLVDPQWGSWKGMALNQVADALAEAGRFDAALQTVERIEKLPSQDDEGRKMNRANRDNSLLMIAWEEAKRGQLKEAVRTAEKMNDHVSKARTLQRLATIRFERGDQLGAREAVGKASSILERQQNPQRQDLLFTAVCQANVGDVPGALQTTSKLVEGPAKGYVLLAISIAQAKAGDRDQAARTFNEGLAIARKGNVEYWTLERAAINQAQAGQFDRALEIAKSVDQPGGVLREVAVGLAKTGDIRRALEIADSIKGDARDKAGALREIAAAQAKAGQRLARQTFQRSFEAAMADLEDVDGVRNIGLAQLRAGYVDAASDTFKEARQRASQSNSDASHLMAISQAQAGGGDPRGALTWARSQSSSLTKAWALVGVVQGLTVGPEGQAGLFDSP
jgi:tetratricopeptide (TPR) repeat protein